MYSRIEVITSKQNPRIKNFAHLQKQHERKEQGVFIVEGLKEVERAIQSGYHLDSFYFCPDIVELSGVNSFIERSKSENVFEVSREVFNRVAYRENSGGVIALVKPKLHGLENLKLPANPLILVIEGIEKPGNIGAIFRTADAAGISAVIICDPATDLYNPNAVRASLGCIFSTPTALCTSSMAIDWLRGQGVQIFSSYLQAAVPYHSVDYTKPSAIVMGTEATGITDAWVQASDANIIIPMRGQADSMNVSTAAAVLVFEACRQREFNY